jgi:hypothetical protein
LPVDLFAGVGGYLVLAKTIDKDKYFVNEYIFNI